MTEPSQTLAGLESRCKHCSPRNMAAVLLVAVALLLGTSALVTPSNNLPDMGAYAQGAERKAAFFDFMRPIVETQNEAILAERDALLEIAADLGSDGQPSFMQRRKLESMAQDYRVEWDEDDIPGVIKTLKRRVDEVPIALVLVQAAKESGWGTSRFAREANNLFGEWCYREGCGVVPKRRAAGAKHEVRLFNSVDDAVAAYLRNINTGNAYQQLRAIRAEARRANREPVATSLANGLILYSQRREAYVNEVKTMIRQYHKFQQSQTG
jgi:Bax protein